MKALNMIDNVTTVNPFRAHLEALEQAGRLVEKHMISDSSFLRLAQLMHLSPQCKNKTEVF